MLGSVGLAGTVFALIEQGAYGWASPRVWIPLVVGLAAWPRFFIAETRVKQPMLPLGLFRVHNFWVGNIATAFVYGALSFGPLIVTLYLQQVAGFSATAAGFVFIPSTLCMLAAVRLLRRAGRPVRPAAVHGGRPDHRRVRLPLAAA